MGEDKKLIAKKVDVIREEGAFFLIRSGLSENDELVMTLPEYPQEGMVVRIDGQPDDYESGAQLAVLSDDE